MLAEQENVWYRSNPARCCIRKTVNPGEGSGRVLWTHVCLVANTFSIRICLQNDVDFEWLEWTQHQLLPRRNLTPGVLNTFLSKQNTPQHTMCSHCCVLRWPPSVRAHQLTCQAHTPGTLVEVTYKVTAAHHTCAERWHLGSSLNASWLVCQAAPGHTNSSYSHPWLCPERHQEGTSAVKQQPSPACHGLFCSQARQGCAWPKDNRPNSPK